MKSVIKKILDEKNNDILKIQGNNGEVFNFEQVALISLDEELFAILHPIAKDVLPDDVLVFRILHNDTEAELILEENEDLIEQIFDEYYKLYSMKNKK